jgi:hypothetical protein
VQLDFASARQRLLAYDFSEVPIVAEDALRTLCAFMEAQLKPIVHTSMSVFAVSCTCEHVVLSVASALLQVLARE